MQDHYPSRETIRERLERDLRAITTLLADADAGGQVLERLPNGEYAWLRPATATRNYVLPSRYVLTDRGRRAMATDQLFGAWPTVAEASPLCNVCGQPSINPLRDGRCIVCELLQRPATCTHDEPPGHVIRGALVLGLWLP